MASSSTSHYSSSEDCNSSEISSPSAGDTVQSKNLHYKAQQVPAPSCAASLPSISGRQPPLSFSSGFGEPPSLRSASLSSNSVQQSLSSDSVELLSSGSTSVSSMNVEPPTSSDGSTCSSLTSLEPDPKDHMEDVNTTSNTTQSITGGIALAEV